MVYFITKPKKVFHGADYIFIVTFYIKLYLYSLNFVFIVILLHAPASCYAHARLESTSTEGKDVSMALLHIALQEGFTNDTVIIRINGKEIFHKPGVKTRLQIGYADSIEINVQEGSVKVEITLPLRNLSESTVLQVLKPVYLGVSITPENKISCRSSYEPFGYL